MTAHVVASAVLLCLAVSLCLTPAAARELPRLKVSENGRFLVTEQGKPFFWLGDTAWSIRKLSPADVDLYLTTRAEQGFTGIQIAPASSAGYGGTDYAANHPFDNGDTDTPNEPFWKNIDSVVDKARDHGLYAMIFPLWGQDLNETVGTDSEKARRLGLWLGRRYRDRSNVLWSVSGEYDSINDFRLPISEAQRSVIDALARGLREGSGATQLMSIHPGAARTSSLDFHHEPWLDLNMLQSGHQADATAFGMDENYALIAHDCALTPAKPVYDGEPMYDDTPDAVWIKQSVAGPRAGAEVMRHKAYWAVFAGAFGHTYGHNDLYCFYDPAHPEQVGVLPGQREDWKEALRAPGGAQMRHLRALMESRPFLTRIPDQDLIVPEAPRPGELTHLVYTRDADGRAALYVNGRLEVSGRAEGGLDNWDGSFRLALANELTQDRPWVGAYHLVALYDRRLTGEEVQKRFEGGSASVPVDALVLYTFTAGAGHLIGDASSARGGITLRISDPSAVEWLKDGGLAVRAPVLIASDGPATALTDAITRSEAITIEAWVRPADYAQTGPARIVTLSQDPTRRSFTLGQDGTGFEVRLRTVNTSENGLPGLVTMDQGLRHVQATRDADGSYAMVYVPTAGQTVTVDTSKLVGTRLKAWWYDPRAGEAVALEGTLPVGGKVEFTSPEEGPDWVLVLDDAAKGYARPGTS